MSVVAGTVTMLSQLTTPPVCRPLALPTGSSVGISGFPLRVRMIGT